MQHGFKRCDSLASADLCGFSLKAAMKVKNAMQPVSTDSCTHRQQMQQQANSRSREWNASRIIKVNLRSMITQKSKLMNWASRAERTHGSHGTSWRKDAKSPQCSTAWHCMGKGELMPRTRRHRSESLENTKMTSTYSTSCRRKKLYNNKLAIKRFHRVPHSQNKCIRLVHGRGPWDILEEFMASSGQN